MAPRCGDGDARPEPLFAFEQSRRLRSDTETEGGAAAPALQVPRALRGSLEADVLRGGAKGKAGRMASQVPVIQREQQVWLGPHPLPVPLPREARGFAPRCGWR